MTSDVSEVLAPCPFCGSGARFVKHSAGVRGTMAFDSWDAVACAGCGATVGACDRRFRNKDDARKAWNTRAQPAVLAVPGWRLVPEVPTPEMIAAATVAVLPDASPEDFELARQAARIVLAHPNAPEGVSLEAIAAAMATIIPAHKAMLAAAPAIHEGGEHA